MGRKKIWNLSLREEVYKELVNHASSWNVDVNDLMNGILEYGLNDPKVLGKVLSLLREEPK